jgi:DNA polymerase-1
MTAKSNRLNALLDGDIIACRAAGANQANQGDEDDLYAQCDHLVREWSRSFHDFILVFSEGRCFRYDVFEQYKANRKGKRKPHGTAEAEAYLKESYRHISKDRHEADDVMGLLATKFDNYCMVSVDKDMLQVPSWVYNPVKDGSPHLVTPREALLWRLQQWLCGDSVDGYPGIRGFGPKGFEKVEHEIPEDPQEALEWGFQMFIDKGYDREYAESQLRCATILHNRLETGFME